MSTAVLGLALVVACSGFALVLNHCHARLALVELTLNEGLPPGHQPAAPSATQTTADVPALLGEGIHVFLSRNCHACQRLIDEIGQSTLTFETPNGAGALHLRYVDKPRPIASDAADHSGALLHSHQIDLAAQTGADPLPYTVAVGAHGLVASAVTPTVPQVLLAARDAGIAVTQDSNR